MGKKKKNYDELDYWTERLFPTSCEEDYTINHLRFIKKHLDGCKKILDVGLGVGRTFSAYSGIEIVEGCDISQTYRDRAIKESKKYNFKFTFKVNPSITLLPYLDNEFDAVVCSEVLLHQRPENIVKIMFELDRVSKKVIIITYMENVKPFFKPNETNYEKTLYCFNYNYPEICQSNNWKIFDFESYKRQIFFVYSSKG